VSHRERDHAHGAAERGNDWLDGALAGWLLFIAISAAPYLFALREGVAWPGALYAAAPLLAVASIFPLLRFHRIGWFLALLALGLMVAHEAMDLAGGARPRAAAVFLVVHLVGLGYLLWIIPEFWPKNAHAAEPAPAPASESAAPAESAAADTVAAAEPEPAASAAPAEPTPVTRALAAIHQRIVAAGSACAVTNVSIRAEAGRFGVTPAGLRTEGLALYRTFLRHFLTDGQLSPEEERELICLERALDLDDDGVWRLRAEFGLVGGMSGAAPAAPQPALSEPPRPAETPAVPSDEVPALTARQAAEPDPSAQADITSSVPRFQSPGLNAEPPVAEPEPSPAEPAPPADLEPATYPAGIGPAAAEETATPAWLEERAAPRSAAPGGLADYEEHEMRELLRWAGIPSLPAGTPPRTALERLRALHRTSTEPLEACASDYPLESGEQCLAIRTVELYRVPPGAATPPAPADVPGPVLNPPSLVDGSLETDRDLAGFQRTGVCRFVLTERRLLLVAPSGQQSPLPVNRVRAVRPFRNGLEVQPQRGSPVFLAFTGGVDDVAMRIDRAATDLRAGA
jgi:hypothetical protein